MMRSDITCICAANNQSGIVLNKLEIFSHYSVLCRWNCKPVGHSFVVEWHFSPFDMLYIHECSQHEWISNSEIVRVEIELLGECSAIILRDDQCRNVYGLSCF